MFYSVRHVTRFRYSNPVRESVMELKMQPRSESHQALRNFQIITKPRIAPGYEQFWKPGNPDPRGRLLATFQTIRQTAVAEIRAGERGGYLVYVVVEKELEDLAKPTQARIGGAVFQAAGARVIRSAIQARNGPKPSVVLYCSAAAPSRANTSACALASSSIGNVSGAGRPPANERTSGRSVTLRISRIADAFTLPARFENVGDLMRPPCACGAAHRWARGAGSASVPSAWRERPWCACASRQGCGATFPRRAHQGWLYRA